MWILTDHQPVTQTAERPPLTVHASHDGAWLRRDALVELRISRPLEADERLAVLMADADWTGLFDLEALMLRYRAGPVPLPPGESSLRVFVVSRSNEWREIGTLPLRVLTPSGFERAEVLPKIDLTNKGQIVERHQPDAKAPARATFQDFNVNVGLRSLHARRGATVSMQVNALGTSNQQEALRFNLEGNAAPLFDLADYLVGLETARAKVVFGHLAFSPHRHLISGVVSRGVALTARTGRFDATAAALNGTAIVGFDNIVGLSTRRHQIDFAVIGAELGGIGRARMRVEASVVDGARLPRSGFTQGQINDAERSRGVGLRLVGADPGQRFQLDTSFARSRFVNPADSLLAQGFTLTPARERTNDAAYLEARYQLLKGVRVMKLPAVGVTTAYRFERVEPLYRTVAAPQGVAADVLQHVAEITVAVGSITGQVSETWSHDNLGRVASLLRTDTRLTTASVLVPTGTFRKAKAPAAWFPLVSYALNRSGQRGASVPVNGGFVSPSQIPDQMSASHALRADWTMPKWRFGYSVNHSSQDNRQQGRERADFGNLVQVVTVGTSPSAAVDLIGDIAFEGAANRELDRVSRTRRIGLNAAWRITPKATFNALIGRTALREAPTSRSDITDINVQYTHLVALPGHGILRPKAQLFVRGSWQSADIVELLFGGSQDRRNLSVNTGLTITVF